MLVQRSGTRDTRNSARLHTGRVYDDARLSELVAGTNIIGTVGACTPSGRHASCTLLKVPVLCVCAAWRRTGWTCTRHPSISVYKCCTEGRPGGCRGLRNSPCSRFRFPAPTFRVGVTLSKETASASAS